MADAEKNALEAQISNVTMGSLSSAIEKQQDRLRKAELAAVNADLLAKMKQVQSMLEIIKGNIYPDGKKSKNFFVIDDPKNICKEYNFTYKSGIEGHRYIFEIKNKSNLDYLEMLIKQKYNQVF